jgi:hypothetical protein
VMSSARQPTADVPGTPKRPMRDQTLFDFS